MRGWNSQIRRSIDVQTAVCRCTLQALGGSTPVDPAGGHCYRAPTKPCESRGSFGSTGGRLSNTWTTYPRVGDNLGKLRLIPHRPRVLEGPEAESSGARGWVCGLSGSWWCKGPPSLRRVRALRGGARRWTLRHESRPYGAQQARNLRNARKRDEGSPSALPSGRAFPESKKLRE